MAPGKSNFASDRFPPNYSQAILLHPKLVPPIGKTAWKKYFSFYKVLHVTNCSFFFWLTVVHDTPMTERSNTLIWNTKGKCDLQTIKIKIKIKHKKLLNFVQPKLNFNNIKNNKITHLLMIGNFAFTISWPSHFNIPWLEPVLCITNVSLFSENAPSLRNIYSLLNI